MFGVVEIVVISSIAVLAVAPIIVIIYLLYKIAKKQSASPPEASIPDQIEQLAKLKDQGVLSEAEFEEKKKELHVLHRRFAYRLHCVCSSEPSQPRLVSWRVHAHAPRRSTYGG